MLGKEPYYKTEAASFFTTFYNLNWSESSRILVEEVANRVNSTLEQCLIDKERFGETADKPKNIGRIAQKMIGLVISDPSISAETMTYKIGISSRAVEKQIAKLSSIDLLSREDADFGSHCGILATFLYCCKHVANKG